MLSVGFTNVYAEDGTTEVEGVVETSEIEEVVETISSSSIPLEIRLYPEDRTVNGVTSHEVSLSINWYDGVSNSFHVSYTNAYGQLQLNQTFYNYSVEVEPTVYYVPSGGTRFIGNHYASVTSTLGMATASGTIIVNRR